MSVKVDFPDKVGRFELEQETSEGVSYVTEFRGHIIYIEVEDVREIFPSWEGSKPWKFSTFARLKDGTQGDFSLGDADVMSWSDDDIVREVKNMLDSMSDEDLLEEVVREVREMYGDS